MVEIAYLFAVLDIRIHYGKDVPKLGYSHLAHDQLRQEMVGQSRESKILTKEPCG